MKHVPIALSTAFGLMIFGHGLDHHNTAHVLVGLVLSIMGLLGCMLVILSALGRAEK